MAILPKNPDQDSFIEGLNYCIENTYLTAEDKEAAIQAGGITEEQWTKIESIIREGWGLSFAGRLIQIRLDSQLISPESSKFKQ